MSLVESKSLLAKLLAEENLTVEHRKVATAYFEVKNRVLVCPILKDMPADLYDLLMGHEVGHALLRRRKDGMMLLKIPRLDSKVF